MAVLFGRKIYGTADAFERNAYDAVSRTVLKTHFGYKAYTVAGCDHSDRGDVVADLVNVVRRIVHLKDDLHKIWLVAFVGRDNALPDEILGL